MAPGLRGDLFHEVGREGGEAEDDGVVLGEEVYAATADLQLVRALGEFVVAGLKDPLVGRRPGQGLDGGREGLDRVGTVEGADAVVMKVKTRRAGARPPQPGRPGLQQEECADPKRKTRPSYDSQNGLALHPSCRQSFQVPTCFTKIVAWVCGVTGTRHPAKVADVGSNPTRSTAVG